MRNLAVLVVLPAVLTGCISAPRAPTLTGPPVDRYQRVASFCREVERATAQRDDLEGFGIFGLILGGVGYVATGTGAVALGVEAADEDTDESAVVEYGAWTIAASVVGTVGAAIFAWAQDQLRARSTTRDRLQEAATLAEDELDALTPPPDPNLTPAELRQHRMTAREIRDRCQRIGYESEEAAFEASQSLVQRLARDLRQERVRAQRAEQEAEEAEREAAALRALVPAIAPHMAPPPAPAPAPTSQPALQ